MAGITSTGLGSGIDVNKLVSQLVAAEATPATNRLNRREGRLQTELSSIGTLKSALSEFKSSLASMGNASRYDALKATVGDSSLFTATVSSIATAASYNIEVKNLAQTQSLAFTAGVADAKAAFGGGTLTIKFGSYSAGAFAPSTENLGGEIAIAADSSLTDIAVKINEAKLGVSASVVKNGDIYQLALNSSFTGAANSLQITVGEPSGQLANLAYDRNIPGVGLTQTQPAKDAEVVINGLTITNATDTFSSAITGVTINLKSAKPGTTTQLGVARDPAAATEAVESFVEGYNKLFETIKSLTGFNAQTQQGGPLSSDAGTRAISAQLQRLLGETVIGSSAFRSLSSVGISTQRDGTLTLDSGKLQAALDTDRPGVIRLFAGTEASEGVAATQGVADRFTNYLESMLASKGALDTRIDNLNQRITGISTDREALNLRLQKTEQRLSRQFNAMDALVGQLSATSSFLSQQLAGMANIYNNKK
ncbi:MAG: flagellar filament capping protein FliD [Candidatus Competibacteraceae bacterium]|nr:flagellar filament capping protein FliD [Candidatus Competibacteraceae bacterium]